MRLPRPRTSPASWRALPRRTARLRLTLLYGVLFFLLGLGMLVVANVLIRSASGGVPGAPSLLNRAQAPGRPTLHPVPGALSGRPPASTQAQISQLQEFETKALRQHASDMHVFLVDSAVTVGIMTAASLVLGWFIAGRVLRPVRTITATARAISASNLHERLALDGPDDEFKRLADTLDDLIARLEAAFEAQRHFVANASHELRTPVTLERTLLQLVLADPGASAATLRSTCEELMEGSMRQGRLIESLLTLASTEPGLERREPFDLADVTRDALRTPREEIETHRLDVRTAIHPAPALGDPALAGRLIANLIDNAARYNARGGWIEVGTGIREGRGIVSVANTGPVVSPADVDRLFQPFQRLSTARAHYKDGHGLGLSIVRAIAAAHDASLAARARDQGGLHIEVAFPAPGATAAGAARAEGQRAVNPSARATRAASRRSRGHVTVTPGPGESD
jgi:signal transduction histidine kinase